MANNTATMLDAGGPQASAAAQQEPDAFDALFQWTVADGSVDLVGGVGPGVFGAPPEQPRGRYVDLGGSTGDPGLFETRQAFAVTAGQTFNLTFDYRSTGGERNTAAVTVGDQTFAVTSGRTGFQTFSRDITFDETGLVRIAFQNAEGDRDGSGIGIDGVLFGPVAGGGPGRGDFSGTPGDDRFTGGDGDDDIRGVGGADTLSGSGGQDSVLGGDGNDQLSGGAGDDTVRGENGDDRVEGGDGNDRLLGGAGADTLDGGLGADTLTGNDGRDSFVFDAIADSTPGVAGRDVVVGFARGEDLIDLAPIDADPDRQGDQRFAFIDQNAFSGDGGEVRAVVGRNYTRVSVDVDGDQSADFAVSLVGRLDLSASDFTL